jgi:hypothetical protein
MEYFQLTLNSKYDVAPILRGWSAKYDTRHIDEDDSHKLPHRELLFVEPNEGVVFPDVLHFPIFLVSKKVLGVIEIYEPNMVSKQIVLLDGKHGMSETYYMPILKSANCFHKDTEWNRDGRTFKRLVLDRSKLGKDAIFHPEKASHTIAVVRLDLAESILRRNARGIGLAPVEVRG